MDIKKLRRKKTMFLFWAVLLFYELIGLFFLGYLTIGEGIAEINWGFFIMLFIGIVFPPIAILTGVVANITLSFFIPYWGIIGAPIGLITIIYFLKNLRS